MKFVVGNLKPRVYDVKKQHFYVGKKLQYFKCTLIYRFNPKPWQAWKNTSDMYNNCVLAFVLSWIELPLPENNGFLLFRIMQLMNIFVWHHSANWLVVASIWVKYGRHICFSQQKKPPKDETILELFYARLCVILCQINYLTWTSEG